MRGRCTCRRAYAYLKFGIEGTLAAAKAGDLYVDEDDEAAPVLFARVGAAPPASVEVVEGMMAAAWEDMLPQFYQSYSTDCNWRRFQACVPEGKKLGSLVSHAHIKAHAKTHTPR